MIVNDYKQELHPSGADTKSLAPIAVVMPPFFDEDAPTRERARFDKGSMHPKVTVVEFDGGTDESASCASSSRAPTSGSTTAR